MHRAATAAAWLSAGVVVAGSLASGGGLLATAAASNGGGVTVTGEVAGLSPHEARPLVLTVHNDTGAPVLVTALTARVTDAAGCPAGVLRLSRWDGALTVTAGGTAEQELTATVLDDACVGARWDLAYTADLRS